MNAIVTTNEMFDAIFTNDVQKRYDRMYAHMHMTRRDYDQLIISRNARIVATPETKFEIVRTSKNHYDVRMTRIHAIHATSKIGVTTFEIIASNMRDLKTQLIDHEYAR
jgi:hypothetical protein